MKTTDDRAKDYIKKVKLSPGTYPGDVETAYTEGASDQRKIDNDKVRILLAFIFNKPQFAEVYSVMREVHSRDWPHEFNFPLPESDKPETEDQEKLWEEVFLMITDAHVLTPILDKLMKEYTIIRK